MQLTDLKDQLKAALMDSYEKVEEHLEAIITAALRDFSRACPLTASGQIDLQADVDIYPAPADLMDVKVHQWGQQQRRLPPWDPSYPRNLPRLAVLEGDPMQLQLSVAPSAGQISKLGARMPYVYYTERVISDGNVPVRGADVDILLVRAQAEAMRYLANQNVERPVATRSVVGSQPKNGTPAALSELYMTQYREMLHAR